MERASKFKYICVSLLIVILSAGIFIKCIYFHHKLPTKSVNLEDIKSVQIINLDRAKERRANYEKMLSDNFGDTFMGRKIGEEIRLQAVDGKKEIVFENLDNGKKYKYEQIKGKEEIYLKDRQFKIYSEKDPNNYWYFSFASQHGNWRYNSIYNIFGCNLSHWKAIENISKQPKGTYGLILEDDFLIEKDFNKHLQNILNALPADADVIKISLNQPQSLVGFKKLPFSKKHIKNIMKSYHKYGYGDFMDLSVPRKDYSSFTTGCQGYLVTSEGAKKIIEYTRNHFLQHTGNDNNVYYWLPKDEIVKSYIYLKEVPVLLSDDAKISSLVKDKKYQNIKNNIY